MNYIILIISIILLVISIVTSIFAKRVWLPLSASFLSGMTLGISVYGIPKGLLLGAVLSVLIITALVPGGRATRKAKLKARECNK